MGYGVSKIDTSNKLISVIIKTLNKDCNYKVYTRNTDPIAGVHHDVWIADCVTEEMAVLFAEALVGYIDEQTVV